MDQFRLLCLFSFIYVASVVVDFVNANEVDNGGNLASVVVDIGYANKVDDGKPWTAYWHSALPMSPLPSKAVQQILSLAGGERSYSGIGKNAVSLAALGANSYSRSNYTASGEQVKVEPGLTTFFQEKDLQHLGKTVTLRFLNPTRNKATLLPRHLVKSIPFSSNKLPEILSYFGVIPRSPVAETMKWTMKQCESPAIKGEEKYCATSLESLIDFAVSKLGKHVQVYATEAANETGDKQEFTIDTTGVQCLGDRSIVCHKQNYAYGVFYCHKFDDASTRAYMVPLVGADGVMKARAVVVCHIDTTAWNPKHLAFLVLKIKPGNTIPVCHFLATNSLLWVPI